MHEHDFLLLDRDRGLDIAAGSTAPFSGLPRVVSRQFNVIKVGSKHHTVNNKIVDIKVGQPFHSVKYSGKLVPPTFTKVLARQPRMALSAWQTSQGLMQSP